MMALLIIILCILYYYICDILHCVHKKTKPERIFSIILGLMKFY